MGAAATEQILNPIPFRPRFPALWDINGHRGRYATWSDFRHLWSDISADARELLLSHLYDKFCTFGYVGLKFDGILIENDAGKQLLAKCVASGVDEWSNPELALATTFWLFESAGVLLTEYNQKTMTPEAIAPFAAAKRNQYRRLAGLVDDAAPCDLLVLCREISTLRASIPAHYMRCFSINGATWEREERYLEGPDAAQDIYPNVRERIENHLGHTLPRARNAMDSLEAMVDTAIGNSVNPFEILVAITQAALEDDILDADYAVVTVPQGRGLDTPWNIGIQDVCSYAVIRKGFDPAGMGVEFQPHQIVRAIERRMRHNTSCRSKNYHPLREVRRQAQPFQFPDIAINESSHHLGHIKSGINNSARTHFEIRIPSLSEFGEFRGFGDFRVNRVDNSPARYFTFDELAHLLPYGQWCKAVFDYSICRNALMDAKYCTTP